MTDFTGGEWRSLVDGQVIIAIPDEQNLQSQYVAGSYDLSEGDTINSDWTDKAGSFNAVVNGSPTFRASAINGEPAVEFDSSNPDYFDTRYTHNTNDQRSVYIVLSSSEASTNVYQYGAFDTAGSGNRSQVGVDVSGPDYIHSYADGVQAVGSPPSDQFILYSQVDGAGSSELVVDGSSVNTLSYTGQGSVGFSDYIGARNSDGTISNPTSCQIAEIMRYSVKHDSSTRQRVESYLNNKYSVY